MRRSRLAVMVVLLGLVQGCMYGSPPSDDELYAYAEQAPPIGVEVDFFFYTHCGVESARIGGQWWHAKPPLYGEGGAGVNPPAGWDNPYQKGRLVVESSKRAIFTANDTKVVLVRASNDEPRRLCR